MSAPIGNTCPDINKIVKKLCAKMREIRQFKDYDNAELCEGLLDECFDVMEDAEGAFEDLRKDNDTLRTWGKEMEEEAESLQVAYNELEEQFLAINTE
jgi:hypothetical protein